MTGPQPRAAQALAPVRAALLAAARAEAEAGLGAADREVAAMLEQASGEAAAIRAQARAQGAADMAGVLADERSRARRQARGAVLGARREAYEELRRRARHGVTELARDPAYAGLARLLAARARADLGPDATVVGDATDGVVLQAGERRAVYRWADLADAAVAALGADLEGLWAP